MARNNKRRKVETGDAPVRQCAWCLAVYDEGEWVPFDGGRLDDATHGMCPECEKEFYKRHGLGPVGSKNPRPRLLGTVIMDIRPATAADKRKIGWNADYMVIELSGGTLLFASSDYEFNDAGVLNYTHQGQVVSLVPPRKGTR